jgi:hypothetical protein
MAHQVTCPSCGSGLRVPDDVTTTQLSCPRCLAQFDNPASASLPVQETPPLTVTSAGPPPACPRCGGQVQPIWRFCPNCQSVLGGSKAGRAVRVVDEDVRRDTKRTSIVLVLLAVLGGQGLVYFILMGIIQFQGGGWEVLIAVLLAVLFLGLITTGIMFHRTRHNPSQRGFGRVGDTCDNGWVSCHYLRPGTRRFRFLVRRLFGVRRKGLWIKDA